jgi:hypothetical protein
MILSISREPKFSEFCRLCKNVVGNFPTLTHRRRKVTTTNTRQSPTPKSRLEQEKLISRVVSPLVRRAKNYKRPMTKIHNAEIVATLD